MSNASREALGMLVRAVWVAWARKQPNCKPSWLAGWAELDEGQREVDMRIGEAVATAERERLAELAEAHGATYSTCPCDPARGIGDPSHKPSPFSDLIREQP